MVKTIICSVGTSAAKALGLKPKDLTDWVKKQNSVEDAAEQVFSTFREITPEGENLKNTLSAEIHSLVRIGITDHDRIILLASSTDDGYCCALAVEKYLKHHWNGIEAKAEQITGLQVVDAALFRKEGVVNFVKRILKEVDQYDSTNIILNPTGGYKALVPYTVLLGMLKGIKCDYIFEQSTTLLELPPLPVEFKRSQFEIYKDLFEKIERETEISQTEWEQRVHYTERQLLEPLVEFSNNQVTISAVGFLFLEEMRKPSVLVPFLSQKAIRDCFDNLAQLDDCDPFRFLLRAAASKDAFSQYEHINLGNGLRWLKPGRTTDRYLVSVEGWRLLVWRAIREDQEGSDYASKVKVNPDSERRAYSPFMRVDSDSYYEFK
ncbi:putative CRISPR-associated protein [Sphaerospermopsis sp. LEGE 08334]|uniref:putative CRISPR-associated protein n=1 Tax=Sphaerospermopsis sp. LEGE 08334 TaxID=1828651 RepID=UPI00188028CC|nr:putative CRISPR-associated protein [Sphaerospermopsis sp. LEGE 08334]MBE9055639.1 putative CRISPR-associated protein [Sphaerospermopsis sp. LEGE 08334]